MPEQLPSDPIPMIIYCPMCCYQHLDEGEWATRLHRTHQCQHCSHKWRPANVATVGVAKLLEQLPKDLNSEAATWAEQEWAKCNNELKYIQIGLKGMHGLGRHQVGFVVIQHALTEERSRLEQRMDMLDYAKNMANGIELSE